MPQKHLKVCRCHDCKVARRKGLVLGSRLQTRGWGRGEPFGRDRAMYVSDYVPFMKFLKGRSKKTREAMKPTE